jgi:hypothetical protein
MVPLVWMANGVLFAALGRTAAAFAPGAQQLGLVLAA